MCLAVPAKITRLERSGQGTVDYLGSEVKANFSLVPKARPGDWVIIHAGFAISVMDENEARETLQLFKEMAAASR
ncbi:MAG: HypC/HybG/HupF family hydrogenase formation chaperone [Candidatus Aminicenantes bacterium]|nr:HypC/HybG/HupF family hydrogenase formation chaperone [Candidatus Aminicenantes bacterium]